MDVSTAIVTRSSRSAGAKDTIMRTAERLYAEHGFANVSIRMIREAAGQRNKSAVQYHFSTRDELIQAILSRHAAAVDVHRLPMVAALEGREEVTSHDWITCAIAPSVEHHIELGTPSWYGRFLAQAVVEPSLRERAARATLTTPSFRRLERLRPPPARDRDPVLSERHAAMVRLLVVHMSAELEADLAAGRTPAATAERSWRALGDHLVTAVCGLSSALLPQEPSVRP
ncbi:MAG: TetR/AcrR family transcriptional regulator [Nonomuraea sp.]|nr:TetR/AcrR family transcriptional regulator [Nonomuraea sp.]NUP62363.1 TetR/AcrR family transcriptional regulator [Nonomuraea sp.]NUP81740.1 TetR/AcrR family transcriptional regulator [Nonomuraea sp.]NUS04963.1 TetR/AcrR family transcriptional regulator [Nonomuraea sp.]NUT10434.1 TetR/AcrR family transcriptional regulator [Nonomuraea sp.]